MNNRKTSNEHEKFVAKAYGGRRSTSSGASVLDKYDVASHDSFLECKSVGGPGLKPISTPKIIKDLDKITNNAYEVNKMPGVNNRYFLPDHPKARLDGYVYISIRWMDDDVELERNYHPTLHNCDCEDCLCR